MQSRGQAINTETLRRLQAVYDAAWEQLLHRKSKHTFPWAIESTRFLLARVVLEYAQDHREQADVVNDVVEKIEATSNGEVLRAALR
jgi:hypothetical protein